jgi:predicted small secreted protein
VPRKKTNAIRLSYFSKSTRNAMFKRLIAAIAAALCLVGTFATLGGCNTIEGAGKDIEKGGSAIKNEAKEQKKY